MYALQINDWPIRRFAIVIISLLILLNGLILLNLFGFDLLILREVVGFIFLTFIPGFIVLRILKLHHLGTVKSLLFSTGLSLSFIMLMGLFINIFCPIIGISNPISLMPIIIALNIFIFTFLYIAYIRDHTFISLNPKVDSFKIFNPYMLFLILLPFLAIFGTYTMNFYGNNVLQMILLLVIAAIPFLIAWNRIPENLFPLGIFTVSLSLLYHTTLISQYIWGTDINFEYYLSNLVLENFRWNPTTPENANAMLSIVMLAPIYSIVLKMNIVWIFKIIYPFLFSLVPLGLFVVYQKQTGNKIAFLACFFFVSIFAYYTVIPALARQEIAELFLVLLIILLIDKNLDEISRFILLIIFGASLIVSHYGVSYIFMLSMILAWFVVHSSLFKIFKLNSKKESIKILKSYPFVFILFTITWYMYVSSSSTFDTIIRIGSHILSSFNELLNPVASQAMNIAVSKLPFMQSIERYLHLITQIFIAIGIVKLISKYKEMKFNYEYIALSFASFGIAVAGIGLPYFSNALNSDRLYHLTLFFLAPFCIIGALTSIKILIKRTNIVRTNGIMKKSLGVISIFFALFLLFNSAFIYEIFDQPKMGRFALNNTVDFACFNNQEFSAAKWLKDKRDPTIKVHADINRGGLLGGIIRGMVVYGSKKELNITKKENSYVFIGTFNIKHPETSIYSLWNKIADGEDSKFESRGFKVYDNGGSWIFMGE